MTKPLSSSRSTVELEKPKKLLVVSEMARRIQQYDWGASALGDQSSWSAALRTAIDLCLGSRMCSCIYWGPSHLIIYNDAYGSILGTKHPWALGRSALEVWPEIFDVIGPLLQQTYTAGITTGEDDAPIFINRSGYVEEFYCSFSYAPLINHDGEIEGVFATLPETSVRVIGERRLRTLQQLGVEAREAQHPEQILEIAAEVIRQNPYDIPFAALYSWRDDASLADVRATANIDIGLPLSPRYIALDEDSMLLDAIQRALQSGYSTIPLDESHQPIPCGAWNIPATELLILGFHPYADSAPNALILAGVSPHKQLDEEYVDFFRMFANQLERSLAEAFNHEQQEQRAREIQMRALNQQRAERVRIARDLHDTLLQSMQGMRFLIEAGLSQLKAGKPKAAGLFENALHASDSAIEEGRQVLSLLRSTTPPTSKIESSLQRLGDELVIAEGTFFDFDLVGKPQELVAEMWAEAYGICREAVANAVRHAEATSIHISVEFADHFIITVQDNGCGIDEMDAMEGRTGHFGIVGMQERAANLGAMLDIGAQNAAGTTVTLIVPAERAYL